MATRKNEYVTELPEDCVQIKQFKGKRYNNFFYSPSENAFYQSPVLKYKKLVVNSEGNVRPKTEDDTFGKISAEALKKYVSDTMVNTE